MIKNTEDSPSATGENISAPAPNPMRMPSPPDFLVKMQQDAANRLAVWSLGALDIQEGSEDLRRSEQLPQGVLHTPTEKISIDVMEYQRALNDRRQAEINNAEIYDQCLELSSLNEKLLRFRGGTVERFKRRARKLHERTKQILMGQIKVTQIHLDAAERAVNDMQIENESLRTSLESYEEAHKTVVERLNRSEAALEQITEHSKSLAEEFENRGILLDEAGRKIRGYLTEMDQLNQALRESHERLAQTRDGNLSLQNQMRELQLRESGISALNSELTDAINKSQRQIHGLEDRLILERKQSQSRIAFLEQETERLRENIRAESLVEKSLKLRSQDDRAETTTEDRPPVRESAGLRQRLTQKTPPAPSKPAMPTSTARPQQANQWNDFYNRWSHIIDGLSSHSTPIESKKVTDKELNAHRQSPQAKSPIPGSPEDSPEDSMESWSQAQISDMARGSEQLLSEACDIETL